MTKIRQMLLLCVLFLLGGVTSTQAITKGVRPDPIPAWAALLWVEKTDGLSICSGVAIAPSWIVTAKHCVRARRVLSRALWGDCVVPLSVPGGGLNVDL